MSEVDTRSKVDGDEDVGKPAAVEPGRELEPVMKPVSTLRKVIDWVVGLALIGLGIVGLFLPVLQGLLFIGLGLMVLSSHSRIARRLLDRLKRAGHDFKERVDRRRKKVSNADG